MKKLSLQIPDMQSEHCRMRVGRAIDAIKGVELVHLDSGFASLNVEDHESGSRVIESIKALGYRVIPEELTGSFSDDELRFETNLNCAACVAQVAHSLDSAEGVCHWSVDTKSENKELVVHSEGIAADKVIEIIRGHGFNIRLKPLEHDGI